LLASVSDKLVIWNFQNDGDEYSLAQSAECSFEIGVQPAHLHALTWNHNQQVVAVGGTDSKVHLIQANTGGVLTSLPFSEDDQFLGDVSCLSFSHSSRYLASAVNETIKVWDLKKRNLKASFNEHQAEISCMLFSPEETMTVSGDSNGVLKLWNVDSNSFSDDLIIRTGTDSSSLNCMQFIYSNPHQLVCGYGDGSLALWNLETSSVMRHIQNIHRGPITGISMSPKNDRLVATSGKDGFVHLNDLLAKPASDGSHPAAAASLSIGEHVSAISFHDSAFYMAVGTLSGYIQLYDWRSPRKPVCQVPAHNPHTVKQLVFQVNFTLTWPILLHAKLLASVLFYCCIFIYQHECMLCTYAYHQFLICILPIRYICTKRH
jgi:WD40 repeat protein